MRIVKINPKRPSLKIINLAANAIKKGGVIIYPTDTIYGLGANAPSEEAIKKIYQVKERSEAKPLSVIVRDIRMARKYCVIGKFQEEIFSCLFPGPFTLILPVKKTLKKNEKIFTVFKNTLSVRIPDYKITEILSKVLKAPFTATSANISGFPGSGDIKKVLKQLKNKKNLIDLVIDAGVLPERKPSVIIDLTGKEPKTIRR